MNKNNRLLIIISGPSGIGKSSICEAILKNNYKLGKVVTCTSRPPRSSETKNSYIFLNEQEFKKKIADNLFVEHSIVYGFYYGVLQSELERVYNNFTYTLLVLNTEGSKKAIDFAIKKKMEYKSIFLTANDISVIEQRLIKRGDPEHLRQKRLMEVKNEIESAKYFDKIIYNGEFSKCFQEVQDFIYI